MKKQTKHFLHQNNLYYKTTIIIATQKLTKQYKRQYTYKQKGCITPYKTEVIQPSK